MGLTDFKYTHKDIDRIYKISKISIAIFFIICSVSTVFLPTVRTSHTPSLVSILSGATLFISAIIAIVSTSAPKANTAALVAVTLSIGILGFSPYNNVVLLFSLPIVLSLYSFNKKIISCISFFSSALFIIASNLRAYKTIISTANLIVSYKVFSVTTVISIYEVTTILYAALPIFMYYINSDYYQWEFRKEKMKAENDILNFCSMVSIYHNKYLETHIKGVKEITKVLLDGMNEEGLNINPYYYNQILFSVQFHDIGKTYISPNILDKPGKLTEEELKIVQEHPERGAELLELIPKNTMDHHTFDICRNIVLQHHERRDGSGYPQGLKGDNIRFEAEIVAVADVLDALLSWRPYKPPMSFEKVRELLESESYKYNELCLRVALKKKDEILEISNRNNLILKEKFCLENNDIERT